MLKIIQNSLLVMLKNSVLVCSSINLEDLNDMPLSCYTFQNKFLIYWFKLSLIAFFRCVFLDLEKNDFHLTLLNSNGTCRRIIKKEFKWNPWKYLSNSKRKEESMKPKFKTRTFQSNQMSVAWPSKSHFSRKNYTVISKLQLISFYFIFFASLRSSSLTHGLRWYIIIILVIYIIMVFIWDVFFFLLWT